eukprot:5505763-Pyramimonas_sp.AAC.1
MSSTGKPVTDFFRPLSQMRNGSHHNTSGAAKPSLIPEYNLRQSVFGSVQAAMSGAQIKGIAGTSASFRRGEQWAYEDGTHTPIRFTFWNVND